MIESSAVAVLISVYANDTSIAFDRAMRSILEQADVAPPSIHIYLGVDGPVPAELSETIEHFRPQCHKVLAFKRNRGLCHVLNDLINVLDDEWLVFRMDADDVCAPLRFRRQIDFMMSRPDIDILGTAITEVRPDGTERVVRFATSNEVAVANLYKRGPVAHPSVCVRRRVFEKLRYPCAMLSEDIALWFECALNGFKFANLPEPLLFFTVGDSFWKRRGAQRAWVELKVWLNGVRRLDGYSWRLAIPLARFAFRLSPQFVQKLGYGGSLRRLRGR